MSDPPWPYKDKGSRMAPDQRGKRVRRKGYRTLAVDRIAEIPVREVVAKDALLFLWTTDAHLIDGSAARVIDAWGFEGKRLWVWGKRGAPTVDLRKLLGELRDDLRGSSAAWGRAQVRRITQALRATAGDDPGGRMAFGGGHYVRGAHEQLVICRRGHASFTVHDERSLFFAPRRRSAITGETHSTKPEELLAKVERVCPGPRLELFARSQRPGWTAWGDQVQLATRAA